MSTAVAPFIPDRFRTTVPFYVAGRLNYPPRLIENVAAFVGLLPGEGVLDLGCGPGFLAIAFAKLGYAATGVDPDSAMLAAAKELAVQQGADCAFREGSSYDLGPGFGSFKLVTMGRSFHWMDRRPTLASLDRLLPKDGAVALFNDRHTVCKENAWVAAYEEVRARFEQTDAFRAMRRSGEVERHEVVLIDSAFSRLETLGVIERRELTIDTAVARGLSLSACAPGKLGENRERYEAGLRETLAPFAPNGRLTEIVAFDALIARRP